MNIQKTNTKINILEFLYQDDIRQQLIERIAKIYLSVEQLNSLANETLTMSSFIENIPNNNILFTILRFTLNDDTLMTDFISGVNKLREKQKEAIEQNGNTTWK